MYFKILRYKYTMNYHFLLKMWVNILMLFIILFLCKKFFNGTFSKLRKSMDGKVIIITGASAGLGKVAAFQLLEDGATVIFACRNKAKTLKVIEEFKNKTRQKENASRAHFIQINLTSFEDVFKFAAEIKSKFNKIDVLMNNAGLFPTNFVLSQDGIESTFQANHLSHMLLSFLLLDHFNQEEGRIINLSSLSHNFADCTKESIDEHQKFENFIDYESKYYKNMMAKNTLYGNTKLGNIFFTQYMANYLEKFYPHIKTVSVHPGGVQTEFTRFIHENIFTSICFLIITPLSYFFMKSPLAGAQTQLHLTYMDQSALVNGGYYKDCHLAGVSIKANNIQIRDSFIDYSWKLIKSHTPEKLLSQFPAIY